MFFKTPNYKGIQEITKQMHDAILACVSNYNANYSMTAAYCEKEKNRISASDGRMVIVFNIPEDIEIETGYYIPVKVRRKYFLMPYNIESKFLNIDKVIPNYENDIITNQFYKSDMSKNSCFIFSLFERSKCVIDLNKLNVLKFINEFDVRCGNENQSVLFYNDYVKFIVMPMRKE